MNKTKRSLLICAVSLLLFVSLVITCFAVAADFSSVWQGGVSSHLAGVGTENDPYRISSGDDLALFSRLVAEGRTFEGEYVVLCSDIDMGGSNVTDSEGKLMLYPIGFDSRSSYIKGKHGVFCGTFDGFGHAIYNIYQNVEQLRGVYNGTQYNAAMGLFGHVEDATIKNLFLGSFTIGGADTDAGCVTAYASGECIFENISLVGCSAYTADGSAAGIVGFDMAAQKGSASSFTFRNITIDASNSIGAQKDSFDVHVGGLVGYLAPDSTVSMIDCHAAHKLAVNMSHDGEYVGGGMLVGSVGRHNGTELDLSLITAENCGVHFVDATPVDQLFAGYGYGITPVRVNEFGGVEVDHTEPYHYAKFSGENRDIITDTTLSLGELFSADTLYYPIKDESVQLYIEYIDGTAAAIYEKNAQDWSASEIAFSGIGSLRITVCDYYYCKTASIVVNLVEPEPIEKFTLKFPNTDDYIYRVGNGNAVTLGTLFGSVEGADIDTQNVTVTVEALDAAVNVGGAFTQNTSDWTKSSVKLSGTGVVRVTVTDNDYCIPTALTLEVVNANNATGAAGATQNNVVLLSDGAFGSLEVKNGYAIYGNGFTLTCTTDTVALDMGYSFVTLDNGTLDNVKIVCPNFSYSILYDSAKKDLDNQSENDENGKTRYHNVRSAVLATGNNVITNSYISGGRSALYVTAGTTTVDNSIVSGGAVANIQVNASAAGLVLRDSALVMTPNKANVNDTSKTVMGFSVIMMCDDAGASAPLTVDGKLVQYAWITETEKQYVPSGSQSIVDLLLGMTDYVHTVGGKPSLNLGVAYLPSEQGGPISTPVINDTRTDRDSVVYELADVTQYTYTLARVYSYKKTADTPDESYLSMPVYTPAGHEPIPPELSFTAADENKVFSSEFDKVLGVWQHKLTVNLDAGAYNFSFSDLKLAKDGVNYEYTVTDVDGNRIDKSASVPLEVGNLHYTIHVSIERESFDIPFVIIATKTSISKPELVSTAWGTGICVASSKGGTWHGAAPALDGIVIRYWSTAEAKYKDITLSDYTPAQTGKLNGTNNTYTLTGPDFTLTMTGGQVHSSNNVYAMPVVCDRKLYFLPAASTGLVNTGNSARSVPVSYVFKDNATDEQLTFSHTWSIAEDKDNEYKYSDFCNGTMTKLEDSGNSSGCVSADTLITLADGTQKRVDALTGDELLLVWDLETGRYKAAPIVFVDSEAQGEYDAVHLYFSDGSDVEVIYEHGFFDLDLGRYVYITADNYAEYIGHRFVTLGDTSADTYREATLCDVVIEKRRTRAYSPVTARTLCYYTNGVLSMPGGISGLFNIFDVDTDTLCYDEEKKVQDIEKYGLLTLEDYCGMISGEAFYVFNGEYLGIAIEKGMLTWEDIAYMAQRYIPLM